MYRRIGSEAGQTRQTFQSEDKATYLFIVLNKATPFVAAAREARVCEIQLCGIGMGKVAWGKVCGTYGVKNSIVVCFYCIGLTIENGRFKKHGNKKN